MSVAPSKAVRQARHVSANRIRLHYVRLPNGQPPPVLTPGITSPAASRDFVAARLAECCDVYGLGNRGCDLPPTLRPSIRDQR